MIKKFLSQVSSEGTIVQIGTAKVVECINGDDLDSYLKKSENKDIYFLAGVKKEIKYQRAKDIDIEKKKYVYFDLDIRKDSDKKLSDDDIKEIGFEILEKMENTKFSNWAYIVFSGNGLHIYFIGDTVKINKKYYSAGYKILAKELSEIIGWECDTACNNLARIARLPGSYNNKKDKKLVEVIAKQEKKSDMLSVILKVGKAKVIEDNLRISIEEEKIKYRTNENSVKFERIQSIPVSEIILDIFPLWEFKNGKNFVTPEEGKDSGCFVSKNYNAIIAGGSREFNCDADRGFTPFGLVRELKGYTNGSDVFQYFEDRYPAIKALADEERREYMKEHEEKKEPKEIGFKSWTDLLLEAEEETLTDSPDNVLSYGYKFIDDQLGGLFKGELCLIGGITNTGKTTLALKIAEKNALKGKKVVIIALEERLKTRAKKAICYEINRKRKLNGKPQILIKDYLLGVNKGAKQERLDAMEAIKNPNIEYVTCDKMLEIEDLQEIYKKNADLYVLDHLHYFSIDNSKQSKADAIEKAMQEIKNLTTANDTRTILIAHFQKIDEAKRPTMTNFKDSMSIAQTVDTIMMLWRDKSIDEDDLNKQYLTEFIIPKNRIGQPSVTIEAKFDINTNEYKQSVDMKYGTMSSDIKQTQNLYKTASDVFTNF